MHALARRIAPQLAAVPVRLALPGGLQMGPADAEVTLRFSRWSSLAALAAGRIGDFASEVVEGRVALEGAMRPLMQAAVHLLTRSPLPHRDRSASLRLARLRSWWAHTRGRDARQIRFHYDVGDDFYALWLDPHRVYSCAYFRQEGMSLAQAQEAKLDLICRKLMLRPGDRLLDIGAGWGGLLLWAARHYGVQARGITLSRNQHAHVSQLIAQQGLGGRVRIDLMDYRDLDEDERFDKIASVGMFEHVGQARMDDYFGKIARLLRPGGLLMNHGITSGSTACGPLGAGMGDFIGRYIFPGGELLHVSQALRHLARAGLEMVDVENLRPHYARTLWAWSDALESRIDQARAVLRSQMGSDRARAEKVLRAYRLYLAGCAMSFEQGWLGLHQVLATRPGGQMRQGGLPGAQSDYPFCRDHVYVEIPMLYKFKSKATGDLIMLEPNGRKMLQVIGKEPGPRGIIQVHEMAQAVCALEQAIADDEAQRRAQAEAGHIQGVEPHTQEAITLRHRAKPLIDMLRVCENASADIVWGV